MPWNRWPHCRKGGGATRWLPMRSLILVYSCKSTLNYRVKMGSAGLLVVRSYNKLFGKYCSRQQMVRWSILNSKNTQRNLNLESRASSNPIQPEHYWIWSSRNIVKILTTWVSFKFQKYTWILNNLSFKNMTWKISKTGASIA
jgi:hypothetical protein